MRVTFVFDGLGMGGAQMRAVRLIRLLEENGDVRVRILGMRQGPLIDHASELGIPCSLSVLPRGESSLPQKIKNLARTVRFIWKLRKTRPDVVMPWSMRPNILCNIFQKYTGAGATLWNMVVAGERVPDDSKCRRALRKCRHFISNSRHAADYLVKNFGVKEERIRVVYNVFESNPPRKTGLEWRKSLGIPPRSPVAGMLAHFWPPKDPETVIKAWKIVVDEFPRRKPYLVLAGFKDVYYEECLNLTAELGVSEHVIFPGLVEDVTGFVKSCDVGVFSSFSEGLPNAVLEFMAAGLPLVGADIPGVAEALGPGTDDVLFPVRNHEALAERIIRLIRNDGLRKEIGARNRKRILECFDPRKNVEKMLRYFHDILDSGRMPAG